MDDDARLVACFKQIFPALTEPEIRAASMRRLGTWDSAALLMLLARVEKEFRVRFSDTQLNAFTSFSAVLDLLRAMRPTEPTHVD
jgi:acyl carrier protein